MSHAELEAQGFDQRPPVTLSETPGYAIQEGEEGREAAVGQGKGVRGSGWVEKGLKAGDGGEETLREWVGWLKGRQFVESNGGLEWRDEAKL